MNPSDFWKNFRLGEEIHIAGTFIYNGLRRFHELRKLDLPDELFEFLYDLSIGLERLLKIAVVLYEHADDSDQQRLEESLVTHNHLDLLARLRKKATLNLGVPHTDLLRLLSTFYKSLRYDRFALTSVYEGDREAKAIKNLLQKHAQGQFADERSWFGTDNEERYRKFVRKAVLKIAGDVYALIEDRARQINLYTYELRSGSKAQSIFLRQVDITDEDTLWKELLVFFMNTEADNGYLRFLRGIEPLAFDPALMPDYLDCFQSDARKAEVMDELEHLYQEMDRDERMDRLRNMGVIGSPHVSFDDDDDEDIDEEDRFENSDRDTDRDDAL